MVMLAVLRSSARRAVPGHLRLRICSSAALVRPFAYAPSSSIGLRVAGAAPQGALSASFGGTQSHRLLSTAAAKEEQDAANEDTTTKPQKQEQV
jgi:hypothetical protein